MRDRDARLSRIAERQHGVFSGRQAVEAGYPRRTIQDRTARGQWVRVLGDTYRLAGTPLAWQQHIVAAHLAVGGPCAVSGSAALALWGLVSTPATPELTVPWTRRPQLDGVPILRTRRWTRQEMVHLGPVRVTSVARTLLDLAPRLDEEDLEVALDTAHSRGLDLHHFGRYLEGARAAKVPGASRLAFLLSFRDPDRPIETKAETLVLRILRGAGLPLPVPQYWVQTRSGRKRIDFAYPEQRLAIEFDGYETHSGRRAFDRDRARDNELADIGFDRRHITWTMVTTEPAEVAWTVGRALGLEPAAWRPTSR